MRNDLLAAYYGQRRGVLPPLPDGAVLFAPLFDLASKTVLGGYPITYGASVESATVAGKRCAVRTSAADTGQTIAFTTGAGLPSGNSPFTVCAWVYSTDDSYATRYLIFLGYDSADKSSANGRRAAVYRSKNRLDNIVADFGSGKSTTATGRTLADGAWHYVAFRYNGYNGYVLVDGVQFFSVAVNMAIQADPIVSAMVGTGVGTSAARALAVFNRSLLLREIDALMEATA